MARPHTTELIFFWALFLLTGAFVLQIFLPYLTALFLAAVLAVVFHPVYKWLLTGMPEKRSLAAAVSVIGITLLILTPLIFFGILLFGEAQDLYQTLVQTSQSNGKGIFEIYSKQFESFIQKYVPDFSLSADGSGGQYLERIVSWISQNLNTIFSRTIDFILNMFLMIIALFFFLRDGSKIHDAIVRWSPLEKESDESILRRLSAAVGSVVKGSILVAVAQGILTAIGFFIFGVPNPALWGSVGVLAALIPSVGTALINIPGVIYLFFTGHVAAALGLLAWAILVVGLIDNVLRPVLIDRGIHMHPFLILLSVLGGLSFFGPIGFIVGPVILALFFALAELYPKITKGA